MSSVRRRRPSPKRSSGSKTAFGPGQPQPELSLDERLFPEATMDAGLAAALQPLLDEGVAAAAKASRGQRRKMLKLRPGGPHSDPFFVAKHSGDKLDVLASQVEQSRRNEMMRQLEQLDALDGESATVLHRWNGRAVQPDTAAQLLEAVRQDELQAQQLNALMDNAGVDRDRDRRWLEQQFKHETVTDAAFHAARGRLLQLLARKELGLRSEEDESWTAMPLADVRAAGEIQAVQLTLHLPALPALLQMAPQQAVAQLATQLNNHQQTVTRIVQGHIDAIARTVAEESSRWGCPPTEAQETIVQVLQYKKINWDEGDLPGTAARALATAREWLVHNSLDTMSSHLETEIRRGRRSIRASCPMELSLRDCSPLIEAVFWQTVTKQDLERLWQCGPENHDELNRFYQQLQEKNHKTAAAFEKDWQRVQEAAQRAADANISDESVFAVVQEQFARPLKPHDSSKNTQTPFLACERSVQALGSLVRSAQARRVHRSLAPKFGAGQYPKLFQTARNMNRKLIAHLGPTNSGKTYAALNELAQAPSGLYLAPLRLLALEGRDSLLERGTPASLLTGEERELDPHAKHIAATVEMCDFSKETAVAVVDEVQLLADADRGWAWTQAVVGVPAQTVHLVGSPGAQEHLERLAALTGEELEIRRYERLAPLTASRRYRKLIDVPEGSAVVAFSRRDVIYLRQRLLEIGRHPAVIYGALTPEVRREQARRFRDGEADVIVATDAIGMGLNLPISEIIFSTLTKYDGTEERPLTGPELRQIAGRAGRYGHHEAGLVSALDPSLLRAIDRAVSGSDEPNRETFRVLPTVAALQAIGRELQTDSIAETLRFFADFLAPADGKNFRAGTMTGLLAAAKIVDRYALPLADKHSFITVPMNFQDADHTNLYTTWVQLHYGQRPIACPRLPVTTDPRHADDYELRSSERSIAILRAYRWLSWRFPATFLDGERAHELMREHNSFIDTALARGAQKKPARIKGN